MSVTFININLILQPHDVSALIKLLPYDEYGIVEHILLKADSLPDEKDEH